MMNTLTFLALLCVAVARRGASIKDLLDTTYTDGAGKNVTLADLSGKYIGLYFSASWCGGCQEYTPILAKLYNRLHEDKNWEVIWVTHDHNEPDADKYFKEMPWIRLPWDQIDTIGAKMYKLTERSYIPALTMISPEFKVLNPEASGDTEDFPDSFPWSYPAELLLD